MHQDSLYSGYFDGLNIAFSYAEMTTTANELVRCHDCDPLSAHLLCRAITSATLASASLAEKHRLNVKWTYPGKLRCIICDVGQDGGLRALISPPQIGETNDYDELFGDKGEMTVIETHNGNLLNSGTAEAPLHDIVSDLCYFYSTSNQIETSMSAMVGFTDNPERPVDLCQGFCIQALPRCDISLFHSIRIVMEYPEFRQLLSRPTQADGFFEDLSARLLADAAPQSTVRLTKQSVPHFSCNCSTERIEAMLLTLPEAERQAILKAGRDVNISCHFCNKRYSVSINRCMTLWTLFTEKTSILPTWQNPERSDS